MKKLEDYVVSIPDFPEPGIIFRDITSILQDSDGLKLSIDSLLDMVKDVDFDVVVGAESRGFIFGTPVAYAMGKSFVPARKPGKLPRETVSMEYALEYGTGTIELHKDSIRPGQKVVIIDDLIATGGTVEAIAKLVEELGGEVVKICFVMELAGLKGRDKLQKYDVDFGEADMVGENEDVVRIMSIHKSKGLEFPIVIVSGMGKNFNKQDTRSKMVLHPELGIGLDYMDGKKRIKSPTIAKKAIAKQIDLENLGEELRVLYVALTRAKEKLILTGTLKDAPEKLEFFRQQANLSKAADRPLSYLTREGASGYLDWILPAVLSYGDKYPVRIVEAAELVLDEVENQLEQNEDLTERIEEIEAADTQLVGQLKQRFLQRYPYQVDVLRKNKYSVNGLRQNRRRRSRHFWKNL